MNDPVYDKALGELLRLFDEARRRGADAGAAALATATPDGQPSVRTISIARIAASGLAFFVDTRSGKGRQLQANPRAAVCFNWTALHYQAIVEGGVAMLGEAESAQLWRSVPRDYALGHWASPADGSQTTREDLQVSAAGYRQQFDAGRVPLPPSWRAFEIRPSRIALWPSGWQKISPRREFQVQAGAWIESRINP